jgi:hypothetical protein
MKDDKAFVYSGVALLLAIPAVILVAALAGMMEIGDTTTSVVIRSDAVFYPCEDIKGALEFSANNYATVYEDDINLIIDRFNDRWLPQVTGYFSDAGINISISTINVSFDTSTSAVRIYSEDWFKGVNITVTDERGDTKCSAVSGPLSIPVGEDESGPVFFFTSPANRPYCLALPFNITLEFSPSEPAFDVVYSLNGSANQSAISGTTNITINSKGTYYLTLSGIDGLNNSGSSTLIFYVKDYSYVNHTTVVTGNQTNSTDPAKDPSDGDSSVEIEEETSTQSVLFPSNRYFGGGNGTTGWNSYNTSSEVLNGWDSVEGAGSIFTNVAGSSQSGTGIWNSSFSFTTPAINIKLRFKYKVPFFTPGNQPGNSFTVSVKTPGGDYTNCGPGNVSGSFSITTTADWKSISCSVPKSPFFDFNGTYTIEFSTTLQTKNSPNSKIQVNFDDVELQITKPSGYHYEVTFVTLDTEIINVSDHELQLRYSTPTNPEDAVLEIYDWGTLEWNTVTATLPASPASFTDYSGYFMSLNEYNGGEVWARYSSKNIGGDNDQSDLLIDYHRIC